MQLREITAAHIKLIAALILAASVAVLSAQEPFPQVPPGYNPNGQAAGGQPQGGYYPPGGYGRGPGIPSQPTAVTRPDWPGSHEAPTASNQAQAAPPYGPAGPAQGMTAAPPAHAGKVCEWALVLGRVGNDVVLTGDLLNSVDEMMERAKSRIPPEKYGEQRAALVKEVTDGIRDYATHLNAGEPDPAKSMSDGHKMLLNQMIRQQIDVKLIYQDFLQTVPKEGLKQIEENVDRHFDESQLKVLMKREKVVSPGDLETALHAKSSSLQHERRIFQEQFIAQQWAQQQLKTDEEITHEEMIAWYKEHIKQFEHEPKARWEELTVSFSRYPNHEAAYAALASLGNRVLAGASLPDVAKSGSDGPTAHQGGQRDWTHKGSLSAEALNQALFSLPVGQLSPILESADGYHIIRVAERTDLTTTSFLEAQKEIKEKIQKERFEKKYQEYVKKLREKFPIWTVFDSSMQPQHDPDDDDRYSTR